MASLEAKLQGAPSSKLPGGRGSVTVKLLPLGRQAVTGRGSAMASAGFSRKGPVLGCLKDVVYVDFCDDLSDDLNER